MMKQNRKTVEKTSETKKKVGSLRRSTKSTNLQLGVDYGKTEKAQITKIRNESGDITAADSRETKRIIRKYHEQLYANTWANLDDMDKALETQNLPKVYCEEIGNMNRPIITKVIKSRIKNFPTKKSPGPNGFTGEFCQTFKEELILVILKLSPEIGSHSIRPAFYEASIRLVPMPKTV